MAGDQVLSDNDLWGQPAAAPTPPAATPAFAALSDDQVWGPSQATVQSDPVNDKIFQQTPAGQIMNGIDLDTNKNALTPSTVEQMQKNGIHQDFIKNDESMQTAVNDAILKPAATGASHYLQEAGRDIFQMATFANPYTLGAHLFDIPLEAGELGTKLLLEHNPDLVSGLSKMVPDNGAISDFFSKNPDAPTFGGLFNKIAEKIFPGGEPQSKAAEMIDSAATFAGPGALVKAPSMAARAFNAFVGATTGIGGDIAQDKAEAWAKENFPEDPTMQKAISKAASLLSMVGIAGAGHTASHAAFVDTLKTNQQISPEGVPTADAAPLIKEPQKTMAADDSSRLNVPIDAPSALIDKAGNLNMKYVNTAEDAQNMLRQTAQKYADENGTVVPHDQTIAEANEFMGKSAPVTNSANFQDWFKDSKVVDSEGKPVQVYHGTSEDFESFKPSKDGANVRPSYINIKNPYETTSEAWRSAETPTPKDLAAEGYDGVKIVGKDGTTNYAVLDPAQVRSSYDQAFSDRFQAATNDVANGIPDFLSKYNRGDPVNKSLSLASRQMVVQGTTDYLKAAKRFAETGDEADSAAATEAFKRLETLQGIRHEVSAEAGRTLESHKITVGDEGLQDVADKLTNSKLDPDELHKIASTLDTPQEMAKFLNDVQKPSYSKMALYYIMNNYLSGPITHLAYMGSWAVQTLIRAGIETPIASLVGKIQDLTGKTLEPYEISNLMAEGKEIRDRLNEADSTQGRKLLASESSKMTARLDDIDRMLGNATTVMPKEAAARFYGLGEGALDAFKAFGRAFKEGRIQMLPGESTATGKTFSGIKDIGDLLKNPDKYIDKTPTQDLGNNPIVNFGKSLQNPVLSNIVQGAGQAIGLPTRVIGAIHSMQKVFGYSESLNALAYRQAASEGLEGSMRDPATELGARVAQLKNNPPADMMEAAVDEGKYAALMGEPGKFGKRFEDLANTNGWTKVVVPFARVMNNINGQAFLERTPLGVFSDTVRGDLMGKNGNAAQATAWGRMSSGMVLLTGAAYMAAKGLTNGAPPEKKEDAAFERLAGRAPYSVNIGGTNWTMRYFGIPGRSLAIGTDLHDVIHEGLVNDADTGAILGMAAHSVGKDLLDETGMRGVADLWNAINDYPRYGKYYIQNALASMAVPYSVGQGQIDRAIDPILRQTSTSSFYENIKQAMMAKSPFLSQQLVPRVDIFGNPMRRDMDLSWVKNDPVMQALDDISVHPAAVGDRLQNVRLTEQQYFDYATKAGKIFYNNMLQKVTVPEWQKLDADTQADIIHKAQLDSRKQARAYMNMAYPDLAKQSEGQNKSVADDASQ